MAHAPRLGSVGLGAVLFSPVVRGSRSGAQFRRSPLLCAVADRFVPASVDLEIVAAACLDSREPYRVDVDRTSLGFTFFWETVMFEKMMARGGLTAAALVLLAFAVVRGSDITLNPTANATIEENTPTTPQGQPGWMSVYTASNGNVQRSLLQFNLSAIPQGAVINSATLTLYAELYQGDNGSNPIGVGVNPSNEPMEVMRLTQPWSFGGTTWYSNGSTPWTINGGTVGGGAFVGTDGTYSGLPYATNDSNPTSEGTPVLWDVTSLVQGWALGAPNDGLLLRTDVGNGLAFYSGDPGMAADPGQPQDYGFAFAGPNGSYTPVLNIEYTAPEPATLTLLGSALLGLGVVYLRRRGAKHSLPLAGHSIASSQEQDDGPAILSFPSRWMEAKRRAA